ncbi:MAG: HlyD family efflux transporter periplasmic adaptor subunit, partial [Candidatus Eremiobacteraeota bacterium]|nr:HlyD family efflux transporter periplasmic adaptor subunit [Candidatus Eremiobacteraeota bacterium]
QLLKITSPANWISLVGILILIAGGIYWSFFGRLAVTVSGSAVLIPDGGVAAVRTVQAGVIQEVKAKAGDTIEHNDVVATLNPTNDDGKLLTMPVHCQTEGRILQDLVEAGSFVQAGESLFTVGHGERLGAWLFIPFENVPVIEEGMTVHLDPVSISADQNGYLIGKITDVERFPASEQQILGVFGNDPRWANYLLGNEGPKALIRVELEKGSQEQYAWTMGKTGSPPLEHGMICNGYVLVSHTAPIHSVLPKSKEK